MSSNFHNTLGWHLGGVEFHDYETVANTTVPAPHASMQFMFWWPAATHSKKAKNVTAEGWSMLNQGYDYYAILHVPAPVAPPHPVKEPLKLAEIILCSGSKLQMAVQSVTSNKNPLACCVFSLASVNVNCGDPVDQITNAVVDVKSVKTSPTPGDYAAAVVGQVVDSVLNLIVGEAASWANKKVLKENPFVEPIVKQVWRRAPDYVESLNSTLSDTAKAVQEAVDGALQ
jgi:hypothetical protein